MSEAMKMELILLATIFFAIPVVVNTNVNVVVARPFELVHFDCEAQGDFLVWLVNTVALTDDIEEEREIVVTNTSSNGTQHSILTITALPINDGIEIGCIVGFAPYHVTFFDEKRLEVRGVSSVENIALNFTLNNFLFVSWSPPIYHSNDVSREVLNYEVTVTNEDGSLIRYAIVLHTHTEVSNITECDTFNVSVTAILGGYRSATRVEGNEGSYPITLDKNCSTKELLFQLQFSCPSLLSIYIELSNGNRSVFMTSTNWNMEYFNYTLSPFEHYNLVLYVKNLREQVESELVANISTYRVQDTDLKTYSNGSVVVSCLYCVPVAESVGEGCYVMFNNSAGEVEETLNITGTNEETITFKESGNYTVTTYDLVNGYIKGPAIAPEQFEVTIDDIDPSTSTDPAPTVDPTKKTNTGVIVGITVPLTVIGLILAEPVAVAVFIAISKNKNKNKNNKNNNINGNDSTVL